MDTNIAVKIQYAGAIALLCQLSRNKDSETLDQVEQAVSDWCDTTEGRWTYGRSGFGVELFEQ